MDEGEYVAVVGEGVERSRKEGEKSVCCEICQLPGA